MRIYLVFYVALLELALLDAPTIVLQLLDKNETIKYEVDDIIN